MLFKTLPVNPVPRVLTESTTVKVKDIIGTEYTHWVMTGSNKTITLPTPVKDLSGKIQGVVNNSASNLTLSGAFPNSGSSRTVTAGTTVFLIVLPTAGGTYKWNVISDVSGIAELSVSELAAVQGAASPSGANVFATMNDIVAAELTADELAAVQGAATPSGANVFATMADVPAAELTADELAAVQGAASPSASNVFATIDDIPDTSAGFDYVRTGLTGGTLNDLDGIAYANLSTGHTALVNVAGQVYAYRWDATSAAAESSPDTIRADDDGAANGRWILDTLDGNMYEYGNTANTACQGNDARIPTTAEKAALVNYECTALTGGAAGALDALAVATLTDLEIARVVASNVEYMYQFNAAAADAEASPTRIRPDDFGAAGVWYLLTVPGQVVPYGSAANTATQGNDARIPTTEENTALIQYHRTALTGGGGTALDGIAYADLTGTDGIRARVITGDATPIEYIYRWHDTSAVAESSPTCIEADDGAAGNGRWILTQVNLSRIVDLVNANIAAGAAIAESKLALNNATHANTNDPTTNQKAALVDYEATSLTGGGAGALDAIVTAGAATVGAELVRVTLSAAPNQTQSYYRFEKTGVAAESSPDVIRPDDFGTDGQGNWNLVLVEGASLSYGAEPGAVSSSTSGQAGTAETASRSDHNHDLSDHIHDATHGGQLTMPVALSDYTAPATFTPVLDWTTATPEGMTITAKQTTIGKLCTWWIHIISSDPGAGGGSINTITFDAATQPADVGAGTIHFPIFGYHRKDTGAADTWTDMQVRLDVSAAAAGDRKATVKNPVVWADNEVTELFLQGSHYLA